MTNSFTLPSTESIVSEVFKAYNSLPKNGKPRLRDSGAFEWTILAGFCLCTPLSSEDWKVECVSLGTGLRVLPYEKLPVHGDVLHDCHAEIIARRGLLVYLYDQLSLIAQALDEECHIEASADGKWKLKEGIKLVMYVSTLPCGDASTYLLSLQAPPSPIISPSDSSPQSISSDSTSKTLNSTSAKTPYFTTILANSLGLNTSRSSSPPLNSSSSNTNLMSAIPQVRRGRVGYTSFSSLRTKPGRIDSPPSISHSCSDKIAMWSVLGVQGALLSTLLDSIMISMVVIGAVEDDQERKRIQEEVERALGGRLDGLVGRKVNVPEVRFTEEAFQDGRERAKEFAGEGGEVVSCLTSKCTCSLSLLNWFPSVSKGRY